MVRALRLTRLASCIERYARDGGELPPSLDALFGSAREADCAAAARDPATRRAFGYRVLGPMRDQGA